MCRDLYYFDSSLKDPFQEGFCVKERQYNIENDLLQNAANLPHASFLYNFVISVLCIQLPYQKIPGLFDSLQKSTALTSSLNLDPLKKYKTKLSVAFRPASKFTIS